MSVWGGHYTCSETLPLLSTYTPSTRSNSAQWDLSTYQAKPSPIHTIEQCLVGSACLSGKACVLWYTHRVVGGSHSCLLGRVNPFFKAKVRRHCLVILLSTGHGTPLVCLPILVCACQALPDRVDGALHLHNACIKKCCCRKMVGGTLFLVINSAVYIGGQMLDDWCWS